jgi:hypothetical protein
MSSHEIHNAAEVAAGAVQTLIDPKFHAHPGGQMVGQWLVQGAAYIAPGAVAAASAGTAAAISATTAAAVALAPIAAIAAVSYGAYKLIVWLEDN